MPDSTVPELSTGLSTSEELLRVVLDISLNGIMMLRPVYDPSGTGIVDLAIAHLNPAAQQMLQLPVAPAESFLTIYPMARAAGVFDFYRNAFLSGQVERRQNNYQHDGLDGYYLLVAQRQGDVLVVSFTDTNDQPRTAVEEALRTSQARELEARAEAESQRQRLYDVLQQLPANVATFVGPDHVYDLVNQHYQHQFPSRTLRGLPIRTALPELDGQPYFDLLDRVYQTGESYHGSEVEAWVDYAGTGQLQERYFNVFLLAQRDAQQRITGLVNFAFDVTEQVVNRRQVQKLNENLAAINEELQAKNDDFLAANAALTVSQEALSSLNQELEARVTERTQQLQEQRSLLHQILSQVPAAVATLTGPDHRFSFFNDRYEQLSGHRAALGLTVADAFPEVTEQGLVGLLDQVYRTNKPYTGVEMPSQFYDLSTGRLGKKYVDFVYQPLLNGQGEPGGILVFILDSTEKVRARQATEAAAQRLRVLTDALPVLIGYLDRECRYQFANHAYRAWFNQDPAGLLGRPMREVVGEKAYAATQEYMDRALAGERLSFEARMPYREDFVKHVRTDYIPDLRNGEVQGFYTLVTDVTEQTEARQQVQELNEELAAMNEEMLVANEELRDTNNRLIHTNVDLDTFVYTASHDLKAPIANIEGLLLALQQQLPAAVIQDPNITQLLQLMNGAVERFQRTLVHLTDVSKLQQAHTEPAEAVELAPLVEAVRQDLAPALAEAGGNLTMDVSACSTVRFSPKNLRSVVFNLLSNAIKYHDPARPLQVKLLAYRTLHEVVLEVQDNGLGLSEQQQSRLFVMFRRLHTHVDGTGVGLYMVKRMVENADGNIQVLSQPGVGSTFRVVLPNRT